MRQIIGLFLFVISIGNTAAADPCSDAEIVRRVCQRDFTEGSAAGCHCSTDEFIRHDDTGYGKRRKDLINQFGITAISKSSKSVTDAGYQRYLEALKKVTQAYQKLFMQMDPRQRAWFQARLDHYKPMTKEQLERNTLEAVVFSYHAREDLKSDKFSISPTVLNYPNISMMLIEEMLAHQFGHYFDPNLEHPNLTKLEAESRGPALIVNDCFKENINEASTTSRFETFADWMASNVADTLVANSGTDQSQRQRALNWAYDLCDDSGQPGNSSLRESLEQPSVHSERILLLTKEPKFLERIGCGTKTEGKPALNKSCHLWK